MLAVRPRSLETDVAPAWLVSEVGIYSQAERKRKDEPKLKRMTLFPMAQAAWVKEKVEEKESRREVRV